MQQIAYAQQFIKHFLGNQSNRCPSGWSFHTIGATEKCLFTTKSKIEISQLDTFCQSLNATVPYPKTNNENQSYLDAFKKGNVTASVAIRSCHGIVELHHNGHWNPFPTAVSLNAVCETESTVQTGRIRRQASLLKYSSGNKLDHSECSSISANYCKAAYYK